MFKDNFFKKVQDKTNVDKSTILTLAQKLQNANMKDEQTIRNVISEISNITGKEVSKEKLLNVLSTGERRAYYILNMILIH
mgnify:CR=1 FL=1